MGRLIRFTFSGLLRSHVRDLCLNGMLNPKICLFGKITTLVLINIFILCWALSQPRQFSFNPRAGSLWWGSRCMLPLANMCWPLPHVLTVQGAPHCLPWRWVPCAAQTGERCCFTPFPDEAGHVTPRWQGWHLDPSGFLPQLMLWLNFLQMWFHVFVRNTGGKLEIWK